MAERNRTYTLPDVKVTIRGTPKHPLTPQDVARLEQFLVEYAKGTK